jgi:O-antigen ligase
MSVRGAEHAAALEWWRAEPSGPPSPPPAGALAPSTSRAGQSGYYGLVLFTVVLVAAPQEFFPALRPLRLGLVTALVAILVYLVNLASGRARPPAAEREVRLVLALVAWAVVTLPLSSWPSGSIEVMTELFLKAVAVFILLAGAIDSPQRLLGIAWTLALCAVPVALTALRNYQAGVYLPTAPGRIAGYGTSGLAGNPNDLALLLNLILPFVVALATRSAAWWARVAAAGIALISVAAVIITFSRSGFLTLAAIGAIYLAQAARRGRFGLAALVVAGGLAGLLAAPAGYGARLSTVGDIDTDPTGSAQNRWSDTVVAASFVVEHPLVGAGLGMDYLALNRERGARWLSVHNAYLNYAVDLGLPGLALFLMLCVGCLRAARRVERERQAAGVDDVTTRLAGAARISLIAFGLAAFFYPVAYNAYFYYIGGLALAARQAAGDGRRPAASEASDAR